MLSIQMTSYRSGPLFLLVILACAVAGCRPEAGQAAPKKPARSAPEESFNRIVEQIKRRLEHGPGQTITTPGLDPDSGDVSHFTSVEKVIEELIPPKEEGGIYTAKIVIERDLFFMHTRAGATEEATDDPPKPASGSPLSIEDELPTGFPLGDESVLPDDLTLPIDVAEESSPAQAATDKPRLQTPPAKLHDVKRYELAYEDGQWVLKNKVEEESMKLIFEYAGVRLMEGQ